MLLTVGINAGGLAAKKLLKSILKSDLISTIGKDCTEKLLKQFDDVKDLSKYVKRILKMGLDSGVIIEVSEKFGSEGLEWIISKQGKGLTNDLVRKMLKADSLDVFTDSVLYAIKSSSEYSDDIIEQVIKHGEDAATFIVKYGDVATEALIKYGDDALEVLTDYGDDAAEGFKNGKTPDEIRAGEIKNSVFAQNIDDVLNQLGLTLDEFHVLRLKAVSTLSDAEKEILKTIRESTSVPDSNTLMQKVIPYVDIEKYMDGTYTQVGGFVTKAEDVSHLNTYGDIYDSLRLDYTGSVFEPLSDESLGVIRYTTDQTSKISIAYGTEMGGVIAEPAPFTGNGFTGATNGQIIPEYKCDGYLDVEDGAQLIEITKDGREILRAVYSKIDKRFIPVEWGN